MDRLTPDMTRRALAQRPPQRIEDPAFRASAVILLIDFDAPDPTLLYTVRTHDVPTHKGHIAFPGGKVDEGDAGPLAAALRETQEEVGVPPADLEILGELDELVTLTRFRITPFVAAWRRSAPLVINHGEIAQVFQAPLSALADPARWKTRNERWQGGDYPIFYCDYEGFAIWGATAKMSVDLLCRVQDWNPPAVVYR